MQEYFFEPTIFTDFFADPPVRLAEKLKQLTGYDRVFLCNSGTESVEAAHQTGNVETAQAECVGLLRCLSWQDSRFTFPDVFNGHA
ncbi:MAG: aminotransferase class III-fold pyridoxal phosphate-dependent enzyme [Halobacteriota archaeon]